MGEYIMVGCDLHDKNMLLKIAVNRSEAQKKVYDNNADGRKQMIRFLQKLSAENGNAGVYFAYEASNQGFGLYDELTEAGIVCGVLAPTKIARTPKHKKSKTDEKDADGILELLRGHILAGNKLPTVWIPDKQTREDREIVRNRLDLSDKSTVLKAQINMLLKRNGVRKPSYTGEGWTKKYRNWLMNLSKGEDSLRLGACVMLGSLLRQLEFVEGEIKVFNREIINLASQERYEEHVKAMTKEMGVGLLTAMVFLTEIGDANRFSNRRQIGSYLGIVPSSNETGENDDRKGHITHQGPYRVRKALCQAVWSRVRTDEAEREVYKRLVAKNPKHKKIAIVAVMRRLAIRLWHIAMDVKMFKQLARIENKERVVC